MGSSEILGVPISVSLTLLQVFFTLVPVIEQFIKELNRQNIDLLNLLKSRYIDMRTVCDVQKDAIEEENICFDVEMLAPREAEIEEEL